MTAKIAASQPLGAIQQKLFMRMIQQLGVAEAKVDKQRALAEAAEELRMQMQISINNFINACAEEMGIPLGEDGWVFNQAKMRFEQAPAPAAPATKAPTAREG